MHLTSLSTLLVLASSSVVEASALRKHAKYHQKRAEFLPHSKPARKVDKRQSQPDQYLNDKTRPFAVDGAHIPEVDFDIGESYAGPLPIDETGKSLWFWFVPSTNPAASKEITLWLNGGPGCSSLDGSLHEQGPVIWQPGTYKPVRNTWAWTNRTNVACVDQPVGTGFAQGKPNATDEVDVATQFRGFWKNFMDLFDLHDRGV